MDGDREKRVRDRAHAIWEGEGRPHGRHEAHWHQASGEVGPDHNGAGDAADPEGALVRSGAADVEAGATVPEGAGAPAPGLGGAPAAPATGDALGATSPATSGRAGDGTTGTVRTGSR